LPIALALLAAMAGSPMAAEPRANLIAIVTDDQARWAVGAYGNTEVRTPNLDRLAAEGALFMNAFTATPVCSPSRATYFCGLYPTEIGITDWISPDEATEGLGLSAPIWPQALRDHGYATALLGKWHLGTQPPFHPTARGFDQFFGFLGGGNSPMDPLLEVNGKETRLQGPLPDLLVDEAIRFLDAHGDRPFALCLHFRAPHLPYAPVPNEDLAPFKGLDPSVPSFPGVDPAMLKKETRGYYASIHSVDRNVGRLLAALEKAGLAERTWVVFTSDHGYNLGRHGVETKGNGSWIAGGVRGPSRPNMWDTSIRVPLLMRWPGVIRPGTQINEPVQNVDMFRTVLGALGVPVPQNAAPRGRDFSPLLRGESLPAMPALFGQYDLHNGSLAYMRMIRTDSFKLVRHFRARQMDELYDLTADPDEARNVYRSQPFATQRAELELKLEQWMANVGDPLIEGECAAVR
jgi:uncharacterized sulfatase